MKKNFFKKLALVLALVLTVTSLNYAPASAAKTPAWKAKKSVISLQNTYRYAVKNVPSKGKVAWKIGNTKVAKISSKGNVRGVGAGTTTVKATVKNSKGKTVKTLTQKVTVKAPVWVATKDTLKEGERTTFTKQYTAKGAKVKFASSNTEVARVSQKGSVLAVKAGKTTITAAFTMDGEEYAVLSKDVTVEVTETSIQSVTQKETAKLEATFAGDTKNIKTSQFSVVRNSDNVVVAVKSVKVDSKETSKVTIETYADMVDNKEYTVSFKDVKESSATFTATDGVIADLNITPITITAAKATEVKVQTLDAKGVILGSYNLDNAGSNNIEFTITSTDGYPNGAKYYLPKVGDTAKAVAIYHTYKYDANGAETGAIKKEATITAVVDATVISNYGYTISRDDVPEWDSKTFTSNTKIAVDEQSQVYFNIKDSNGDEVSDYADYRVVTSDASKLILEETTLTNKTTGVHLTGVAAGSAYILVQDNKTGRVLTSLPVTVVSKRAFSSIVLDADTVTVSVNPVANETKNITIKANDQYGNKMNIGTNNISLKLVTDTKKHTQATNDFDDTYTDGKGKITIKGASFDEGTYKYELSVTVNDVTKTRTITVIAKEANTNATASHRVDVVGLDNNKVIDTKVDERQTPAAVEFNNKLDIKVARTYGGIVAKNEAINKIKLLKADGTVVAETGDGTGIISGSSIVLSVGNASGSSIVTVDKKVEAGKYRVLVDYTDSETGKLIEKFSSDMFTVVDTQTLPKIDVKITNINGRSLRQAFMEDKYVTRSSSKGEVIDVMFEPEDYTTTSNANTFYVKNVRVSVKLKNGYVVKVKVPVNESFTEVHGIQ